MIWTVEIWSHSSRCKSLLFISFLFIYSPGAFHNMLGHTLYTGEWYTEVLSELVVSFVFLSIGGALFYSVQCVQLSPRPKPFYASSLRDSKPTKSNFWKGSLACLPLINIAGYSNSWIITISHVSPITEISLLAFFYLSSCFFFTK